MEANPKKPGIILNSYTEIIALRDSLEYLMDTEAREEKRAAERQRKQEEYGFEVVGCQGGVPFAEEQYAIIARAAFELFRMEQYDEIFEIMQEYTPEELGKMRPVSHLNETEAELAKVVLSAYIQISKNGIGKDQAEELRSEVAEKLEESKRLTASSE